MPPKVKYLIVDTSAFIKNAPLHEIGEELITIQEVIDEIVNKRQLRRLVVLPYDLKIKPVFSDSILAVTEFAKKTGDYPSLSATDIKIMAVTYQLEKEFVGLEHIRTEPIKARTISATSKPAKDVYPDTSGFYVPDKKLEATADENNENQPTEVNNAALTEKFQALNCNLDDEENGDEVLVAAEASEEESEEEANSDEESAGDDSDDETGWITPDNIQAVKIDIGGELTEEKTVQVACLTTDFAMQNVLKQMNLNVSALDGKMIRELRTFILRCYCCFKTTSIMTKIFCPKCGHKTLKKVAVSVDENGRQQIHINMRRPITARGKRFSLPRPKGGKHSNYPILCEDQPRPDQRPSRLARTKNNPMEPDYIAGYSPFIMRDVNSKSAMLGIRPGQQVKHWTQRHSNEVRRRRK